MRWLLWPLGLILVLVVIGTVAVFSIPSERIAALATDRISQATGRQVRIDGGIRPRLFPTLGVQLSGLSVSNPDWVEAGDMLEAETVRVGVEWLPLLQGEIALDSVVIEAPRVALARDAEGRVSWEFGRADVPSAGEASGSETAPPAEGGGGGWRLGLSEVRLTEGAFVYRDAATGQAITLDPVDITLLTDPESGAIAVTAALSQAGETLEIMLALADLDALLGGSISGLELSASWPGGQADFTGRADLAPAFDGQLALDATSFDLPLALAGVAAPELPAGLGRDRVSLASQITLAPEGSIHLRDTDLGLDGTSIRADLDLLQGEARPFMRGNLALGSVLMSSDEEVAEGSRGGSGTGGDANAGWSTAPIDASGLFALDAELALTAEALGAGAVQIRDVVSTLRLENGRAVLDLSQARLFDGALSGQFVANGRGGFSTRAAAQISDVALGPALTALADFDRLEGTGSASFSLLGVGDSLDVLMRSLEGEGRFDLGAGAIRGLDIAGMIRNFDTSFQGEGARTVYDAVSGSFTVTRGLLNNPDLELSAPWGGITGRGDVDLGGQRLDYLIVPGVLRNAEGGNALSVPVRVEGPWSDLSYRPDFEALAEDQLAEEIDEIEDRLADELRDQVSDRLGVEIDPEASRDEAVDQLEEELGDRLREELEEGILDLFR